MEPVDTNMENTDTTVNTPNIPNSTAPEATPITSTIDSNNFSNVPNNNIPASETKNKYKYILLVLVFILLLLSVGAFVTSQYKTNKTSEKGTLSKSPSITPKPTIFPEIKVNEDTKKVTLASNSFGIDIIKTLAKQEVGKNIVISPLSISLAMSLAYNGTAGDTKTEMAKTMYVEKIDDTILNQESLKILQLLNTSEKSKISIANSVWIRQGFEVKQSYLNILNTFYEAKVTNLDFTNSNAAETMNSWVREKTNNKITSIVSPPIPSGIQMFLINAVYFKGSWRNVFLKDMTEEKDFYNGSKNIKALYMTQTRDDYMYLKNSSFQAIKLPYEDGLNMYIFLPTTNLNVFSKNLTADNISKWLPSFIQKRGTILLPKFKLDYESYLSDVMVKLGIASAFDLSKSNFSVINENTPLAISNIIHKTFIEVNEEGTEAAAVTAVLPISGGGPLVDDSFTMNVNKPFFFIIHDEATNSILFAGYIYNPISE